MGAGAYRLFSSYVLACPRDSQPYQMLRLNPTRRAIDTPKTPREAMAGDYRASIRTFSPPA